MAFESTKVILGYDGSLNTAPVGTPVPATLTTPLDVAWINVGWCHIDGHSFNPNLEAPDPIKAWPRGETVKRPAPTLSPEFTFQLIQHTDALPLLVNPNVEMAYLLEYRDTETSSLHRLIMPRSTITDMAEIAFNTEDPIGHEITVGCTRDDLAVVGTVTGFTFAFQVPDTAGLTVVHSY